MQKLIFATNNKHKAEEIRSVLGNRFQLITLEEAAIKIDIPEPYLTLEENAREKSQTIYLLTGHDCFGEDTGLEVNALNGEPGVKSARYAGDEKSFQKNIDKLLRELKGMHNREARFRTVISLYYSGKEFQFEGICDGRITEESQGTGGFGYDSIFIPDGATTTFANMLMEEKNQFSHRRKAMDKLIGFLLLQAVS